MVKTYEPIGECIYCGRIDYADGQERRLAEEHIIPLGLNGDLILKEASCQACERITGRVESVVLSNHLVGPRRVLGLKSRTPEKIKPKTLPLFKSEGGVDTRVDVAVADYPSALLLLTLPDPPILWALANYGSSSFDIPRFIRWFNYDENLLREKYGIEKWSTISLNTRYFCRMLAKIGHSFAVAQLGLNGFNPILRDMIRDPDMTSRAVLPFVGGQLPEPPRKALHFAEVVNTEIGDTTFVLVKIRLFAQLGAPTYLVVAGTKSGQPVPPLPSNPAGVDALHNFYRISVP